MRLLLFVLLVGCSTPPPPAVRAAEPIAPEVVAEEPAGEEPGDPQVGTLAAPALEESSGLAASRKHPGVFWSHNDSGGLPALFALDGDGTHRGRVTVHHAKAKDWEDLALDRDGFLWIHDGGNNNNRRRDLTVYRAPEPDTLSGRVAADRAVRFRFPDQTEFPQPNRKNHDSEALFWDADRLYVLSKHRSDTRTKLYRFPPGFEADPTWDAQAMLKPGKKPDGVMLELLGDFELGGDPDNFGGKVTAADVSPDGRHLAVLTYHALFVFERPEGTSGNWLAGPHRRIDFEQTVTVQCEALAWDGAAIVFTNEQRSVFRIANPHDAGCTRFPSAGCRR